MKKYSTSERLKQVMNERGLKQTDILEACQPYCKQYGIKLGKSDLSQYLSGKVQPKQDKLSILGLALGLNEVWLMGHDVPPGKDTSCASKANIENSIYDLQKTNKISSFEAEHIKKYRTLDEHGKRVIDLVLNEEYDRCTAEPEKKTSTISIPHSTYKVSAGKGFDLDDRDSWEEIDIPDTPEAKKATFAVTIKGDSMEPIYSDGQIVLVREQSAVDIGETGIYIVNGGGFIKINGGDRLISINPKYDDIFFDDSDSVYCAGKVIGVV